MSTLVMVGVSHHDADLAVLERVAARVTAPVPAGDGPRRAALDAGCAEVLVLATCSRTELYGVVGESGAAGIAAAHAVGESLRRLLLGAEALDAAPVQVRVGDPVVSHLCRVAAGVDSRVPGEVEIRTQLRAAARAAVARHGEPHRLRKLVAAAVSGARSADRAADGDRRRGLLARRAVQLALDRVGSAAPVDVVVVGAGTMGRQITEVLPRGCRHTLLSRTPSTATAVRPLQELPGRLVTADAVLVATSAGRRILTAEAVGRAMVTRRERPLVLVDLSVPRNIDPAVAEVPGVELLDLDDLAEPDGGSGRRERHVLELAAHETAQRYLAQVRIREAGPLIRAVRERIQQLCLLELHASAPADLLDERALRRMAAAVAGPVAHSPTMLIRDAAARGDRVRLDALARAFLPADAGQRGRPNTARRVEATVTPRSAPPTASVGQ